MKAEDELICYMEDLNVNFDTMEALDTLAYTSIDFSTDQEDKINQLGEGNILEGWNYAGLTIFYFHFSATLLQLSMYSFDVLVCFR